MTRIILVGADGRMGKEITAVAASNSAAEIVAFVDKKYADYSDYGGKEVGKKAGNEDKNEKICQSAGESRNENPYGNFRGGSGGINRFHCLSDIGDGITADVILDFSHPSCLAETLMAAKKRGIAAVIGVTGYTDENLSLLTKSATEQTVLYCPNFSPGVFALRKAVDSLARLLSGWDIEVIDTHHNQKADAPSGTAALLLDDLEEITGFKRAGTREGRRKREEIGVHAVRGGTVSGAHEVNFFGAYESVCIRHNAESRRVFAEGAILACINMTEKKRDAGKLYGMDDLLG